MAENELQIRVRLETGEITRGLGDIDNRARRAKTQVDRIQAQLIDLERLEQRLTSRIAKLGARTAAGLAIGFLGETTGIDNGSVGRIGTATLSGLLVGGPQGAIAAGLMTTVGELSAKVRDIFQEMKEIRRATLDRRQEIVALQEEVRRRDVEIQERFDEKVRELREKAEKETDELLYATMQYIE